MILLYAEWRYDVLGGSNIDPGIAVLDDFIWHDDELMIRVLSSISGWPYQVDHRHIAQAVLVEWICFSVACQAKDATACRVTSGASDFIWTGFANGLHFSRVSIFGFFSTPQCPPDLTRCWS